MTLRVAVVDSVPTYRRGLLWALSQQGIAGEETTDVLAWVERAVEASRRGQVRHRAPARHDGVDGRGQDERVVPGVAVLICVRDPALPGPLPALAAQAPEVVTVALLPDATPDAFRSVLEAGAVAAVAYDAPAERILTVLQAATEGDVRLPVAVFRQMLTGGAAEEPGGSPESAPNGLVSEQEAQWLQALARGVRVSELARAAHCSERSMFRALDALFTRMGVTNRHGAIVRAERWRLLTGEQAVGSRASTGSSTASAPPSTPGTPSAAVLRGRWPHGATAPAAVADAAPKLTPS